MKFLDNLLSAVDAYSQSEMLPGFYFEEGGCYGMAFALYKSVPGAGLAAEPDGSHTYAMINGKLYDYQGVAFSKTAHPISERNLVRMALKNMSAEEFKNDVRMAMEIIANAKAMPIVEGAFSLKEEQFDDVYWFWFHPGNNILKRIDDGTHAVYAAYYLGIFPEGTFTTAIDLEDQEIIETAIKAGWVRGRYGWQEGHSWQSHHDRACELGQDELSPSEYQSAELSLHGSPRDVHRTAKAFADDGKPFSTLYVDFDTSETEMEGHALRGKRLESFLKTGRVPSKMVSESHSLYDLDQDRLYDAFRASYEEQTGSAWSKDKFLYRASQWTFYGPSDGSGFVAVRKQHSGMKKLVGVAGEPRAIVQGLEELMHEGGPIWGAVSAPLAKMAKKRGMIVPHLIPGGPFFIKTLMKTIPASVFGGYEPKVTDDGGIEIDYSDVGTARKYLIGNKAYFLAAMKLPEVAERLKEVPGAKMIMKLMGLNEAADLYYVQPDGTWKKNGDGRSKGVKREDLPKGSVVKEAKTSETSDGRTSFADRADAAIQASCGDNISVILLSHPSHTEIHWIEAIAPGNGWGSKALRILTKMADQENETLSLKVALDDETGDEDENSGIDLASFYSKFGFEITDSGWDLHMTRKPGKTK